MIYRWVSLSHHNYSLGYLQHKEQYEKIHRRNGTAVYLNNDILVQEIKSSYLTKRYLK